MDRYAVIGHPVEHSLSPRIHQQFARQTGQEMAYERIEAPLEGFAETITRFLGEGGRGCNVTVPFKGEAAAWVDRCDDAAAFAEAVNTVVVTRGGETEGHNTDGPGLVRDLLRYLGEQTGLRVLLLGAGGAARGVAGPVLEAIAAELVVANRTPERAERLAERLGGLRRGGVAGRSFGDLQGPFDLVINATSAGLDGGVPDISPEVVRGAFCYDLIYGGATAFCRWSLEAGARETRDGLGMLVEQAALAFELWRGLLPDTRPVLEELRVELEASAR